MTPRNMNRYNASQSWDSEYRDPRLMTGGTKTQHSVAKLLRRAKKITGISFDNATVIDFGCGTGRAALDLASRGATVFAFDASNVAVQQAEQIARTIHRREANDQHKSTATNYEDAHLVTTGVMPTFRHIVWSDETTLPQPDNSVDYVLMNMVLHLLAPAARTRALQEINRVLKPGGVTIIRTLALEGDHNAKKLLEHYPSSIESNTYIMPELNHAEHLFTRDELATLLQQTPQRDIHAWHIEYLQKTSGYPRFEHVTYKRQYYECIVQKS